MVPRASADSSGMLSFMPSAGAASARMAAVETTAAITGRRWIIAAHRAAAGEEAERVFARRSRLASGSRSRGGLASLVPVKPSSAGSRVRAPSTPSRRRDADSCDILVSYEPEERVALDPRDRRRPLRPAAEGNRRARVLPVTYSARSTRRGPAVGNGVVAGPGTSRAGASAATVTGGQPDGRLQDDRRERPSGDDVGDPVVVAPHQGGADQQAPHGQGGQQYAASPGREMRGEQQRGEHVAHRRRGGVTRGEGAPAAGLLPKLARPQPADQDLGRDDGSHQQGDGDRRGG